MLFFTAFRHPIFRFSASLRSLILLMPFFADMPFAGCHSIISLLFADIDISALCLFSFRYADTIRRFFIFIVLPPFRCRCCVIAILFSASRLRHFLLRRRCRFLRRAAT